MSDEQQAAATAVAETGAEQQDAATPKKVARRRTPKAAVVADGARVIDLIPVGDVILDPDVQPREHTSTNLISEYADAMRDGDEFEAIVVYRDPESGALIVADGWHRVSAARAAQLATIKAEIRPGTKRDALLYSIGANAIHGQRRTDADKRRAVMRLLTDPEWSQWSGNAIAEKARVSQSFVSGVRSALGGEAAPTTVKTADGRTMNTSRVGRGRTRTEAPSQPAPSPAPAEAEEGDADEILASAAPVGGPAVQPSLTPEPEVEADPVAAYAAAFLDVFTRMAEFDAAAVVAAMPAERLAELGAAWPDIINTIDTFSGALEEALA